jgi:signal transduction histidine kinase
VGQPTAADAVAGSRYNHCGVGGVVGVADRDRCAPVPAERLGLVHLQKGIRAGLFGGFSRDIRTTIFDLHGGGPATTRLRQRLNESVSAFAGSGLRTTVQFVGPLSVVDPALADHAEAVVREAVSNAVRHAHAHNLTVQVRVEDDLCIEVVDDGCGIPADVTASGLNNLRARAHEVAGELSVGPGTDGGTVLRWTAPLP